MPARSAELAVPSEVVAGNTLQQSLVAEFGPDTLHGSHHLVEDPVPRLVAARASFPVVAGELSQRPRIKLKKPKSERGGREQNEKNVFDKSA